jgi:hypothetical protein
MDIVWNRSADTLFDIFAITSVLIATIIRLKFISLSINTKEYWCSYKEICLSKNDRRTHTNSAARHSYCSERRNLWTCGYACLPSRATGKRSCLWRHWPTQWCRRRSTENIHSLYGLHERGASRFTEVPQCKWGGLWQTSRKEYD